ncbi:hypothetical protein QL285_054504 [Trifolium repens]|jgi:hypothetical protein|nr:hypothetical protein QL285_054504 [Trifolium repens]
MGQIVIPSSGVTYMGLYFCGTTGQFVAGLTQWQQHAYSAVDDEAWVGTITCYAMKGTIDRGFKRVQFESDSKVLVDATHSRRRDNSKFSLIDNDIIVPMSFFV